jgi:hypothetical protein
VNEEHDDGDGDDDDGDDNEIAFLGTALTGCESELL